MAERVRVVETPGASRLIAEATEGTISEILEQVAADARRLVPVDTGDLRASIKVLGTEVQGDRVVGRVGAGDPGRPTGDYAAVVEGLAPKPTENYPVQPYLRPALYRKRSG